MTSKINTYVISGFLGAGKTTLLNELLVLLNDHTCFVIENEIGEVNIDSQLIVQKYQQLFEITKGCMCCDEKNELYTVLENIYRTDQKPNHLFIEATGIADPFKIAETIVDPLVKKVYDLKSIITVIDYIHFEETYQQYPEVKKQIVAADIIYINKKQITDTADEIEKKIRSINLFAKIIYQATEILKFSKTTELPTTTIANKNKELFNHKINTVLFKSDSKINFEKLKQVLSINMYLYFDSIYRIKGFVIDQYNQTHKIQTVGKTVTIETVENSKIKNSQLVFIGHHLKSQTVHRILRTCLINDAVELYYL